jgi:sensor histidine kinase regulating citrate/malate metabolism
MFTAEYEYRGEMNTFMNMVRSQRHDYNLHVQTVASLIRQKKWDECLKYVNALTADTSAVNSILPVKDPAIAALIDYYRSLALQQKIRLDVDIRNDLSHVATNVYETNKIIGNLLQNAVDEMKQMKDRSSGIQLSIFKRGEFCMIRVSNRIAEPDAFQRRQESIFNQGYTTKCGHDGVGLSSIRVLANHVGGEVSVWVEGDTVHFIASIPELYVGAV